MTVSAIVENPHQFRPCATGGCAICGLAVGDSVHEEPLGERPDIPARSGVGALLQAANAVSGLIERQQHAIGDILALAAQWVDAAGDDPAAAERRRAGHELRLLLDRWGL